MKTFEERYTEWVDGELHGAALIAFEEELAHRAEAGDAQADKAGAASLRTLLREHLQAPALSNTDFFNHQVRERIERDGAPEARPASAARPWWSFARFGGLAGAAAALVVAALYYGATPKPAAPAVAAVSHPAPVAPVPAPSAPVELAKAEAPEPDLQVQAVDDSTSATAIRYMGPNNDQKVQVLWMDGLEYQADEPSSESGPVTATP